MDVRTLLPLVHVTNMSGCSIFASSLLQQPPAGLLHLTCPHLHHFLHFF